MALPHVFLGGLLGRLPMTRLLNARLPGARLSVPRLPTQRLAIAAPPSVTAHLGRVTVTVRPNRSRVPLLHSLPRGRYVGSVGLGPLAASWIRRNAGSQRWGLEPLRTRRPRT